MTQKQGKINYMKRIRRRDWDTNNLIITNAMATLYRDNHRHPTNTQLATFTGLSRSSVNRHFQHIDNTDIFSDERRWLQLLAGELFAAILNSAAMVIAVVNY